MRSWSKHCHGVFWYGHPDTTGNCLKQVRKSPSTDWWPSSNMDRPKFWPWPWHISDIANQQLIQVFRWNAVRLSQFWGWRVWWRCIQVTPRGTKIIVEFFCDSGHALVEMGFTVPKPLSTSSGSASVRHGQVPTLASEHPKPIVCILTVFAHETRFDTSL